MMVTLDEIRQLIKEGYSKGYNFQTDLLAANTAERITDQKIDIAVMMVKAKTLNVGSIYVGFDEQLTSSNGTELTPKEPIVIPIDRADKVWITATLAADGVEVICLV